MAVLLLLIGISPLATDMYLASLPAMGSSLGVATATIQLTLTGFLIGHAVGQLAIGPISDGMGRRPFLIGGSAAFFILSLVCAVAPNDPVLAAARVAQGFASAAGMSAARPSSTTTSLATGPTAAARSSHPSVMGSRGHSRETGSAVGRRPTFRRSRWP